MTAFLNIFHCANLFRSYAGALSILAEMEQLLAEQSDGVGSSGVSKALFAEHHSISRPSVDMSFLVSQEYLMHYSGGDKEDHSGLSVDQWKDLIQLQRNTTQYKQNRLS